MIWNISFKRFQIFDWYCYFICFTFFKYFHYIFSCTAPELKSLALGVQTLMMRTLGTCCVSSYIALGDISTSLNFSGLMKYFYSKGGITAPVYYGAFIDSTCLKWGMKKCEGRGACRMYDSDMFRYVFVIIHPCPH